MKKKEEEYVSLLWSEYERGKIFNNYEKMYDEGRENYDFYHGKQWGKLEKPQSSAEPITLNIVKPIIKFKTNVVNQKSYQIVFNPNTYETPEELETLKQVSKSLTQFVNRMWEKSQSGKKVRSIVKNSAINSEGIIHFFIDSSNEDYIESEEIDKNNICYGNENEEDIQKQPYIITVRRITVKEARRLAKKYRENGDNELTDEQIDSITSDMDYYEQQGKEHMISEISPMCLILRKYKKGKDGNIYVTESTKTCTIYENKNTEAKLYPFSHFVWESEKGYARGISEVRGLIDNQIEINKTATRRAISVRNTAFPKIAYDGDSVINPEELFTAGGKIELTQMRASDINTKIAYLHPASMSGDAYNLQRDLIDSTRELSGANEVATGQIDPTKASGKAILAVQQAQQQPLTEQVENYKFFLEDCGKIIFEMIKVNFINGLTLYDSEEKIDQMGNTETIETPYKISQKELEKLDLNLKIDVTDQSAYSKMSVEMMLEQLFMNKQITFDEFVEALPEDSSLPKDKLQQICLRRKEARKLINEMQQEMNAINSAINQTLMQEGGDISIGGGAIDNGMSQMQASGNDGAGSPMQ